VTPTPTDDPTVTPTPTPEVKGVQVDNELADTGGSHRAMSTVGILMVVAGAALVTVSKRD
jgi:hypothetical protein